MSVRSVRATRIGLVGWVAALVLLGAVGTSAGLTLGGTPPQVSIAVSNGFVNVNYTTAGFPISLGVQVTAKDATPFSADVYVGFLTPNGEAASVLPDPQKPSLAPTAVSGLVAGPGVPFLRNVVLASDTGIRFDLPSFASGGPLGWYIVFALVVGTGQDPANPKNWVASSFSPVLVTAPGDQ